MTSDRASVVHDEELMHQGIRSIYEQGREARSNGKRLTDCPWDEPGGFVQSIWESGWLSSAKDQRSIYDD